MQTICSVDPQKDNRLTLMCSFYKMFWVFFLFSILGTVIEGTYWIIRYGHFQMRSGLIYGPFSEVYGMAAVLIIFLLYGFRNKSILFLFIAGYIVGVSFEFIASLLQQWIFGFNSWDYGNAKYAIAGRANLIFGFFWGLLAVIFIKKLYPKLSGLIEKIPRKIGITITILVLLFLTFDCIVSSAAVHRYQERKLNIPPDNYIEQVMDTHYTDSYLKKVYQQLN